jgi:hypothetical protein
VKFADYNSPCILLYATYKSEENFKAVEQTDVTVNVKAAMAKNLTIK